MTRHGPLTVHPVAVALREITLVMPRVAGVVENSPDAAPSQQSGGPVRFYQSISGPVQSLTGDHRTVPNHQPNPQSP